MNSPFPGMDPYLEDPAFWADFHHKFIYWWYEAIAYVLPEPYEARVNETVYFVPMSDDVITLMYPDVSIARRRRAPRPKPRNGGGTAVLAPVYIPHQMVQEVRRAHIEIRHRPERSLI